MKSDVEAESYRATEKYHGTKALFYLTILDFVNNSKNGTRQIWKKDVFERLGNINAKCQNSERKPIL